MLGQGGALGGGTAIIAALFRLEKLAAPGAQRPANQRCGDKADDERGGTGATGFRRRVDIRRFKLRVYGFRINMLVVRRHAGP